MRLSACLRLLAMCMPKTRDGAGSSCSMAPGLVEGLQRLLGPLEHRPQATHVAGVSAALCDDLALDGRKVDAENASVTHDLAPSDVNALDVTRRRPCQDNVQGVDHVVNDIEGHCLIIEHDNIGRSTGFKTPVASPIVRAVVAVFMPAAEQKHRGEGRL